MANQWLRLWHDMPNDPKWRTVARVSGQPISVVIALYVHLLVEASRNVTRGHAEVTPEDLASALDVTEEAVRAILSAMQGRLLDDMYLLGWEKRQPKKEDFGDSNQGTKSAAQRKAEQRAREKAAKELIEKSSTVTASHEESRNVTTDKEENREEEKQQTTLSSSDDVRACPIGTLVDLYHEYMPDNPRVKVINESRKGSIRQRWREAALLTCKPFGYATKSEGLAAWRAFFEVCSDSPFLTGKVPAQPGKVPFVADIDFIFSPLGFAKILENKYHREAA